MTSLGYPNTRHVGTNNSIGSEAPSQPSRDTIPKVSDNSGWHDAIDEGEPPLNNAKSQDDVAHPYYNPSPCRIAWTMTSSA
jgi:hypothetical protein